jgi:hypothetical protein
MHYQCNLLSLVLKLIVTDFFFVHGALSCQMYVDAMACTLAWREHGGQEVEYLFLYLALSPSYDIIDMAQPPALLCKAASLPYLWIFVKGVGGFFIFYLANHHPLDSRRWVYYPSLPKSGKAKSRSNQ